MEFISISNILEWLLNFDSIFRTGLWDLLQVLLLLWIRSHVQGQAKDQNVKVNLGFSITYQAPLSKFLAFSYFFFIEMLYKITNYKFLNKEI